MAEAEHTAHTEVAGGAEHHVEATAFGIAPGGFVAIAMLVVFAIMLWKRVPALIAAALDQKIAGIREQLDTAAKLRDEAAALKAEYEAKAKAADAEIEALKAAAEKQAADVVARAKTDAAQLIARHKALSSKLASDPVAAFRGSLYGGDVNLGQRVFFRHQTAQCIRCHSYDDLGGNAGPRLNGVASRLSREQLLEALVNPSARLAPGFGMVTVTLKNGKTVSGILQEERAGMLEVLAAGGWRVLREDAEDVWWSALIARR